MQIRKPADYDPARDGTRTFGWDNGPSYPCHPHGTLWNGFDNVSVSPPVMALILEDMEADPFGCDEETLADMKAIAPDERGLIDLSNCYASVLDDEDQAA